MSNPQEITVTRSTGNGFEDLSIPNAHERLATAQIAYLINSAIKELGLTQEETARILGIDPPNVSRLTRGKLAGFSQERLSIP